MGDHVLGQEPPGKSAHDSAVLAAVPPPPKYDLHVTRLTIGAPPPVPTLPLPIPIPIPAFFLRRNDTRSGAGESVGSKSIIHDVSLECRSGEMLAIIGGSGSGKTTLLNSIVGRLSNLPILSGDVSFHPSTDSTATVQDTLAVRNAKQMKDRIGFVRQNDYLLPHLTVRETLSYAAALRLPKSITAEERGIIVEQTIQELGLRDAANTVVGGLLRKGLSGGERRRLSIGCVLVTLPSVLCLDEPTTGLDAFTAFSLLQTLSRLANRNRTIILSIHQPRSDAFSLFSRLVLLSKGDIVYSGKREACLPWFASQEVETEEGTIGLIPPSGINVLDWMIDISTVDTRNEEAEETSKSRVHMLVQAWRNRDSLAGTKVEEKLEEAKGVEIEAHDEGSENAAVRTFSKNHRGTDKGSDVVSLAELAAGKGMDARRPGMWGQTWILLHRAHKNVYRNYEQLIGFACQSIGVGILLGISFYRLDESPAGIQSLKTLSYQHLACYYYLTLIYMVYRFCEIDLVIFDREREDHLYSVTPWVLSEFFANFPVHVFFTAIFAIILYFMCNLRTTDLAANLFIFIAMNVLVQLCAVGFSLMCSGVQRIYATASLIANALQIFLLLTAGYLLISPPVYVKWIRWTSMYFYGFRVAAISQFRGRTFACEGVAGIARQQCDGNAVLMGLHMPVNHNVGLYFSGLIGLFIVEHVIAAIILSLYHPGGVKHANQLSVDDPGKESTNTGNLDVPWTRVNVKVTGLGLTWIRRSLGPFSKAAEKTIIHDVNINFPAGKVTAILGPSGAGKSTLLQLLAMRSMNPGPFAYFRPEGQITFNGQPYTHNMKGLVAFVEQHDEYHYPALTVRETLQYAAILRLPANVPRKRKLARAAEVLQMLGLAECADTLVGGPLLKGISGGEKRRLSLAVQMISDPSVLIVDEPTSGLDALTASNVMNALKNIASRSGRTVIVTLHQPRSDIYQSGIDNIVLLVKGGKVAYSAPQENVDTFFANAGYPIPPLFNPADHLLDTVSVDNRGTAQQEDLSHQRVQRLLDYWASQRTSMNQDKDDTTLDTPIDPTVLANTNKRTAVHIALLVIIQRMVKNLWRQQPVFWVRLQQAPLLALLFWLFYQRLTHGAAGGQDRIGFVQEFVLPIPFVGMLNSIAIYPADRDIFYNEYASSSSYSAGTFVLAFTIVELPLQILSSLLYTVVMNVGAGMQTNAKIFFEDAAVILMLQNWGESLGIAFASLTQSMGLNISIVSTAITVLCQISGIVSVSVPRWLSILAWGMIIKPAARIVMTNELVNLQLNCPPASIASGECLGQTGQDLLDLLGFRDLRTGRYLGIMLALTVLNRIMAWGALRMKVWVNK